MTMIKEISKIILLAFSLVFLKAVAFSEPSSAPPGGNVLAPINVSSAFQQKIGDLWVNSLGVTNGFIVESGLVGFGIGPGVLPVGPLEVRNDSAAHTIISRNRSTLTSENMVEFNDIDTGNFWEIGFRYPDSIIMHSEVTVASGAEFNLTKGMGNLSIAGKLTAPGGIQVSGASSAVSLTENTTTPSSPAADAEAKIYVKADKLIIQWNEAGVVRYKYLLLSGTDVIWEHTTTEP